jgi:hypothetical protein
MWRLLSECRTVDVACRHVWKLRLHFIFYYLMRYESYGRRTTDVAVCVASLTQCGTHWRVVLASFHDRDKRLIADHPDAKKEMDLVRASIVQIGQLVQNSPKVNGNGAKWKQLAGSAEADRSTLCKWTGANYRLTSHVCTNIQRNEEQPSIEQQGIGTGRCIASDNTGVSRQNILLEIFYTGPIIRCCPP